jgi:hypothetical protein
LVWLVWLVWLATIKIINDGFFGWFPHGEELASGTKSRSATDVDDPLKRSDLQGGKLETAIRGAWSAAYN